MDTTVRKAKGPALVSVYLPTKNRVALLCEAVESVLKQTHRALELIVVNDGSTDGTAAYLEEVQRRDSRVRAFHHQQSRGAPASRNRALAASRGEFVTGLDDDDRFHPERIEALLDRWRTLEANGVQFSCLYTQDTLVQTPTPGVPAAAAKSAKPDTVNYEDLFFFNSIGNQVFTRREHMIEAGMFDEEMPAWQDLDAFLRLVRRFGPARLLDRALYILDLNARNDRLSVGSKPRIIAAYRRLSGKLADHPAKLRQGLFLQVFGRLYGFELGVRDLREYLSYGVHSRTLRTLAGVMLRQITGAR